MGIDESTLFSTGGRAVHNFWFHLHFLLFTLLLDKWGSFPEPPYCNTNLRSSLGTCLLPRIFRNTWRSQQPGLSLYGSEMHTDEQAHMCMRMHARTHKGIQCNYTHPSVNILPPKEMAHLS